MEDTSMMVATTTVLNRLEKLAMERLSAGANGAEREAFMEQLVREQGEEFDIVDAYRFAIDERNPAVEIDGQGYMASAILETMDPDVFSEGCRQNALGEIQDSWLIRVDDRYYRLEGVTDSPFQPGLN
jgi:hypothetical protein